MQSKSLKAFSTHLIISPFDNPLILDSIFAHLSLNSLCSCRLVNKLWCSGASTAIRKSLRTRLLLCADTKCTTNLQKFLDVFQDANIVIPYARAILILDHLPTQDTCSKGMNEHKEGEMELLLQLSDLFSDHLEAHPESEPYSPMPFPVVPQPCQGSTGETVKLTCDLFSQYIENLIINLTRHRDNPENIEYWLKAISFPNLSQLCFHITRTSPEIITLESLQVTFNSLPNLRGLGIRKLTKKGDSVMNVILLALAHKTNLCRLKSLSIEAFTDDKEHLEILLQTQFFLEEMSLIYLGGEVRFVEKMELIKPLLSNLSGTLEYLYTHLPLFSSDHSSNFPKLPKLRTLKIEKVYREFSISQAQLFGFNFYHHFPNIERIIFKDYDLWKNMQLKTFPLEEVIPCPKITCISLPDLCFDAPLMERYFMKFPNLRKLSIIVSYVSRYQRQCSVCMVYAFLPNLKELNVALFEMDLAVYDHIFTGMSEEKCRELIHDGRPPNGSERGLSIVMLEDLEILKITCSHGKKILGVTDLSVQFAFLKMPSLRHFTIGSCLISPAGFSQLAEKVDVTKLENCSNSNKDSVSSTHNPTGNE